ncbi:glycoside hydrolase/phage tail family protein [Rhizobium sp. SSA_523]|uniref:baseplate multidomain protein megatron n=1 Tax=Rhizobium sp. SSA_523 TaxID=2952477 RepID=UPI002090139A|nr:glycoside hydrolase/phage tail family protein [Rhizobium sp. SSA_523]MCO5730898.1 glycoside hydrolase/phage tail family protein [Rhizobium sp. SSA_523]WKC24287.1 glycoside hydrolase/phage tail family protein [Rhizobium sp. SSA_523]
MATILFQAAGAALGSVFGPLGAIIGRAAGGMAGAAIDHALIGDRRTIAGPRLANARIPGADEGTPITRVYGTVRIGGTLIWATRFAEEVTRERRGGKGSSRKRVETFSYFANLAIGICEGEIAMVRRVWADGRELDLTQIEMRLYRGTEDQPPDPLIEAKQGTGRAPAYRGLAYAVFDHLPINDFGNRIPLFQFEVVRPVGQLERQLRAVTLIPGSSEHGYATAQVTEETGEGSARIVNRHTLTAGTDFEAALNELQAVCPHVESVALVVSWFGTDLRAGECRILPGVESLERGRESAAWSVAGIERKDAYLVSRNGASPAYGGTPSDASVRQALADLKARGLRVFLYPFVMMDVPAENALPDPHGAARQAPYPWRGRITCHPAPGRPGSPDGTASAAGEVAAFVNRAEGYRRMILHYAALVREAGGVDGFIIGSEFRGLTQLRGAAGDFPFVGELVRLATDLRAILGPATALTYGADWTEYFGYHPADGSGDVFYHLDPLWACPAITAVGIDNYMPLSDWREEDLGQANPDGMRTPEDKAAMTAAIAGGEGFDWYYEGEADRQARNRRPITDGAADKPWVFRVKDLESWWTKPHYERRGGRELATPSPWQPRSKPIWFTELGCPAIDKGANQPNVFLDPKSSESFAPYFSSAQRSDSMQRRFLEAHHAWWQGPGPPKGMVDPRHIFVWTWDARPYPAFPDALETWSDGDNWRTGHWLNGRMGATTLADVLAAVLTDHGFTAFDVSDVTGDLLGFVQAEVTSARALIEPLARIFLLDVIEEAGRLVIRSRMKASLAPQVIDVLAEQDKEAAWQETRGHASDFPAEVVMGFSNPALDYQSASLRSRHMVSAASHRILRADLEGVLYEAAVQSAADALLRDNQLSRRMVRFSLPPSRIDVMPGDPIRIAEGPEGVYLVTRIEDGTVRRIEARRHAPANAVVTRDTGEQRAAPVTGSAAFSPAIQYLDLPRLDGSDPSGFARVAAFCKPFRRMLLSASTTSEAFRARANIDRPAIIGRLSRPLDAGFGVIGRFDRPGSLEVDLAFGELSSAPPVAVLAGTNRLAVLSASGAWEVLGFTTASEVAPGRFRLSCLLRGMAGTEDAMAAGHAAGAPVVLLDEAVVPMGLSPDERGILLNWIVEPVGGGGRRAGPVAFAGAMRAETPLAPVHARARRIGQAIAITWIRRSRIDADDWNASEIALDEPQEAYRLEILQAQTVVRQVEVGASRFDYALADEVHDFGTAQTRLTLRLRQLGRAVPLGIALYVDIPVKQEGDA